MANDLLIALFYSYSISLSMAITLSGFSGHGSNLGVDDFLPVVLCLQWGTLSNLDALVFFKLELSIIKASFFSS